MIASGLDGPTGIAADSHGNLYIATQKRICIERLSGRKYMQTLITGAFRAPQGVALDGIGDIYVSDYSTGGVYKETVAGGAYAESLLVTNVGGNYVAVDGAGNLYVSDAGQGIITRIECGERAASVSAVAWARRQPRSFLP
jgi:serine/threonine-protein kinase